MLTKRVSDGLSSWKPPDNSGRINARWTNEELLIAVQGKHTVDLTGFGTFEITNNI